MKKIQRILSCILVLCCACNYHTPKDEYLQNHLPKILNLERSEIEAFKKNMFFDSLGRLTSWNSDLLEKAYTTDEEYTTILTHLIGELGGKPDRIIVVDHDNNEKILYPSFYDKEKCSYPLLEVQGWDALFYITSTNCGACITGYQAMNELAAKHNDTKLKFIALFDKIDNIDNYKKGLLHQENGFLSPTWLLLQNNDLVHYLTTQYQDSLGVPHIFFRKKGNEIGPLFKSTELNLIDGFITTNYGE